MDDTIEIWATVEKPLVAPDEFSAKLQELWNNSKRYATGGRTHGLSYSRCFNESWRTEYPTRRCVRGSTFGEGTFAEILNRLGKRAINCFDKTKTL